MNYFIYLRATMAL